VLHNKKRAVSYDKVCFSCELEFDAKNVTTLKLFFYKEL